jgi:hypothetical protein
VQVLSCPLHSTDENTDIGALTVVKATGATLFGIFPNDTGMLKGHVPLAFTLAAVDLTTGSRQGHYRGTKGLVHGGPYQETSTIGDQRLSLGHSPVSKPK